MKAQAIKTIKKSIDINAPKEKVWEVLLDDEYTRLWYAAFSEGTRAETDWQEGNKAIFIDESKSGLIGKVITNKANEFLSIEYQGMVNNGIEDYTSEQAQAVKGGIESYRLTEKDGMTDVSIESDMDESYFESMSAAWEKALLKIKSLAEGK